MNKKSDVFSRLLSKVSAFVQSILTTTAQIRRDSKRATLEIDASMRRFSVVR